MSLLKLEGYKLVVSPELLTIKIFKKLWARDRTKEKDKVTMELGFIYHFCDPRSTYLYITNEEDRMETIKEDQGFPKNWKPDALLKEAIDYWLVKRSTAALLLEDTRIAVGHLRKMLRDIDLNEKDDKGKPIYTLNMVASTIKQVPVLIKDLDEAEKAVAKEIADSGRMRGSGEKTIMEDGF